jgi:hypothetical protein
MKYIESLKFKISSNQEQFTTLALCNNRLDNKLPPEILLYIAEFFDTCLDRTNIIIESANYLKTSVEIFNHLWEPLLYIRIRPDIDHIYKEWEYGKTLKSVEDSHKIDNDFKLLRWDESFCCAFWFSIYH